MISSTANSFTKFICKRQLFKHQKKEDARSFDFKHSYNPIYKPFLIISKFQSCNRKF